MKARVFHAVLASLLLAPANADAQQIKLRAALQVAASDPYIGVGLVRFKEEVEKRTDRVVSVEIFDKGKPYGDDRILGAVSSGDMELGVAGFHHFANKFPAIDVIQQPFLFNFDALVRAATGPGSELRELIDRSILYSAGVRVLFWQSAGNQVLFSKGNVASPDEIKDKKIRVTGEAMAQFAKHCGGKPAILSAGAIHDALKGGTIDMAMAAISTVTHRELWKVSDTVTRTAHAPIEFLLIINEKTWQTLSASHQTIIMEAARHSEQRVRNDFTEVEAGYFEFARQKGMKISDLTPDQVAEWRACGSENLVDYMDKSADLGRQLMAAYARLRADKCCTSGPSTAPFNRH